jgi:malonate-semialdehyde dehydrogenase (acetylating)/methylmalonate-semialdehyde dehydrogenase
MTSATGVTKLKNYVNGEWIESSGDEIEVHNPAADAVIAVYNDTTRADTDAALDVASAAFKGWRSTPPLERARHLMKLKNALDDRHAEIARTIALEHGKTYKEAFLEIERGIENVEVATGVTTLMQGDVLEDAASGIDEFAIRQPLGVCVSLNPFNFPGMIPLWSLPYALACGNTIVVKGSPRVPMTIVHMFEILADCGFPPGVANLVLGGRETGEAMIEHPATRAVSFIGSTHVGKDVYRRAAEHGKRVQVGAGAKNFGVVMPDANMDQAIANLVASSMGCSGQRCLALAGVITVGDAYDKLRDGLVEATRSLKVGFALDESAEMGPVISRDAQERIQGWIERGASEGASPVVDGRGCKVAGYPDGYWVGPTLLDKCEPGMQVSQEEIFGPVLSMLRVGDLNEAIELINESRYGNAAAIYTSSGASARKFRYEANAGNIGVNIGVAAPMAYFQFGGSKDSFFGSLHAQGKNAFEFFSDAKICIERWFD